MALAVWICIEPSRALLGLKYLLRDPGDEKIKLRFLPSPVTCLGDTLSSPNLFSELLQL